MSRFFHRLSSAARPLRHFFQSRPALIWPIRTLYWLPIGVVFCQDIYVIKSVSGTSMRPTLNPESSTWRDIIIFDRFSIRTCHQYSRGDIVALKDPVTQDLVVKRIIALAGDTVQTLPPYPDLRVVVPEGHAWVEGDEPFRTADSNKFGPVPLALFDSKLLFIIWPLKRFGPLAPVPSPSILSQNTPRGPAWRHEMEAVERDKWRKSRVTISPP